MNPTTKEIREVETEEKAVEQGALLLDKYRPGWHRTVNGAITDGLFRMDSWESCMVGTLELWTVKNEAHLEYHEYIGLNGISFRANDMRARWMGFLPIDIRNAYEDFDKLEDLWRAQVEKRLAMEASA
jgi:hypothetical protein